METLIKIWPNGDRLIVDYDVEIGRVVISSDINDTNEDRLANISIKSKDEMNILHIRQYAKKGEIGSCYKMFDSLIQEARLDRYGSPLIINMIKDKNGNED